MIQLCQIHVSPLAEFQNDETSRLLSDIFLHRDFIILYPQTCVDKVVLIT